jgi:L-lactate dehydrogenase
MKVGVIGVGRVGSACALSLVTRGSAREVVLVDLIRAHARAVATDLRYGAPVCPEVAIYDGDYADLTDAAVVMITAGLNEKGGGATDRNDATGRLKLLDTNIKVYQEVIPQIVAAAPDAILLVVTDPPDPLADLTRALAGHDRVLSTGTLLDTLRFRVQLAERLHVSAASIEALVIGEHGTSEVLLWSAARVNGVPIADAISRGDSFGDFRQSVERDVRYANITIIEGNDASQFGIGIVSTRITEAVLRDERVVLPVGAFNAKYGVTLSLPCVVDRNGPGTIYEPAMNAEEKQALKHSADVLCAAGERIAKRSATYSTYSTGAVGV